MTAIPAAAEPAIELRGVHKSIGRIDVLRGVSLEVPRGSICALLGPNGAGKSTMLKLLLGMSRADRGEVRVLGHAVDGESGSLAARARIGFVAEAKELPPQLTGRALIDLIRPLFPRWREDLERRMAGELALPLDRRIHALSKGMRSKLAWLLACCRGAELLLLDEPTDSLDPGSAERMLELMLGLVADDGVTVLLASHQLHEVERVADRLAILDRGRVVLEGELDDLRTRFRRVRVVLASDDAPAASLYDEPGVVHTRRIGRTVTLLVDGEADALAERAGWLTEPRVATIEPVSLRSLFLSLTSVD